MKWMIYFYTAKPKNPEFFFDCPESKAKLLDRVVALKRKKVKFTVCRVETELDFS